MCLDLRLLHLDAPSSFLQARLLTLSCDRRRVAAFLTATPDFYLPPFAADHFKPVPTLLIAFQQRLKLFGA
ncbi:hypothetical protein SDJN03_07721, partial [Cucurbita argyrosperma subsp. sororia]